METTTPCTGQRWRWMFASPFMLREQRSDGTWDAIWLWSGAPVHVVDFAECQLDGWVSAA